MQQWPVSVKLHRQVSTQMVASLPARCRICWSAVPVKSDANVRFDFVAGTGNSRNWRTPAARALSNWGSSELSVWREVPGRPSSGSSFVAAADRNRGWIRWLTPNPISDVMSRSAAVARNLCSRFIALLYCQRYGGATRHDSVVTLDGARGVPRGDDATGWQVP